MNAQEILNSLKEDLKFYKKFIQDVSEEIINSNYSQYPIFVAHQNEVKLGELILDKDDFDKKWSINATILDELVQAGIVDPGKVKSFQNVYKNPKENICVFLISEKGGNFVFIPYNSL